MSGPFLTPDQGGEGTTAIWMLEEFLTNGDYTLTLSDSLTGDTGTPLDGEWSNADSTAPGD